MIISFSDKMSIENLYWYDNLCDERNIHEFFLQYSMLIITIPPRNNIQAIAIGIIMPVEKIVAKKRPGGVVQAETKLFPANIMSAKHQIVPIKDKNPPIKTFFINVTPCN